VAIKVTYLGGTADSYTLNFSRPASGVYVQLYKFLRLGQQGYRSLCTNMMSNTAFVRRGIRDMKKGDLPRFVMLDAGDSGCLPVVAAMLNPALKLTYDEVDLQHLIAENHWYVSAYHLSFHHPGEQRTDALLLNVNPEKSMFRIVVKSNLTHELAGNLLETFNKALEWLDSHGSNFSMIKSRKGFAWPSLAKLANLRKGHEPC
jgi:glutamate decarboxylase